MDEVSLPSLAGLIPGDAAALDAEARLKQAQAQHCETSFAAAKLTAEAEGLLALARQLRDPPADLPGVRLGRGGEVSPLPQPRMPVAMGDVAQAIHSPPDMLAAEASLSRLSLAREAGVLTEAVDAAESIGAEGAIEQMLVHAITAAHRVSMQLMAAAGTALRVHEHARHTQGTTALLEANRSALAAARLMDSTIRGAAALDRILNGGRQHVTVQHVVITDGGQAVVAGSIAPGDVVTPWKRRGRGRGLP